MTKYVLIDDDQISNLLHQEVLRQVDPGAEVKVFNSSLNGLEMLKEVMTSGENIPEYLFLDIRMPEMDGFEVLDELMKLPRENVSKMKIFMLTSSLDDRDRSKSAQYPIITEFRGKTLTIKSIKEILNK